MNSKFLLLILSSFILFTTYCYSQTKPRKSGLGLRYGIIGSDASFQHNGTFYIGSYENSSYKINNSPEIRNPFFIQFDEELITNWASSDSKITFDQLTQNDIPPAPTNQAFDNSPNFDYEIRTSETRGFPTILSKYQTQINSLSNPSLSANIDVININWIKQWGVFIPFGNYRIFPIKLGLGVSYSTGEYEINLCDPYIIKSGLIDVPYTAQEPYQRGVCSNKLNIVRNNTYQDIGLGLSSEFTVYSYIDEDFEFNFFQQVSYSSIPSVSVFDKENLNPVFKFLAFNFISFILYF